MAVQHNAHVLAARFHRRAAAVQTAIADELSVQGQLVARALRAKAAKFRTELTNSIHVQDLAANRKKVAVGSAHGWYVEKGVKPGGKGLPRFFDPEAADAVAWLQTKLRAGARSARRGSRAFQAAELALRDAYEGWAHHVRRHGVKAQPFVEPTGRAMARPVAQALRQRAIAAVTQGDAGARQ